MNIHTYVMYIRIFMTMQPQRPVVCGVVMETIISTLCTDATVLSPTCYLMLLIRKLFIISHLQPENGIVEWLGSNIIVCGLHSKSWIHLLVSVNYIHKLLAIKLILWCNSYSQGLQCGYARSTQCGNTWYSISVSTNRLACIFLMHTRMFMECQ